MLNSAPLRKNQIPSYATEPSVLKVCKVVNLLLQFNAKPTFVLKPGCVVFGKLLTDVMRQKATLQNTKYKMTTYYISTLNFVCVTFTFKVFTAC